MAAQAGEVILFKELGIANLHRVAEFRGKSGEERVEAVEKFGQLRETATAERAEFENQQRGLFAIGKKGPEEHLRQYSIVQECLIGLAGLRPISRMRRKYLACNLLGHLESEAEGRGHLLEEFTPEFFGRELIKGEIAADGGEGFGVFAKAVGFKALAGEAAARQIAVA